MSTIAVIHAPLGDGGSEHVCFCVLEALQDRYDVTFVTDKDPEIERRNRYYGTDVDVTAVSVRSLPSYISVLFETWPRRFWKLKQAFVNRHLRHIEHEYDLIVSTMNEYDLAGPSVQYIHYPTFQRIGPHAVGADSFVYTVYDLLRSVVIEVTADSLNGVTAVANSRWTANVFEDAYGVRPRVVYPPVRVDRFDDVEWSHRENGFVSVSRLSPKKRVIELIEIVATLVDDGHDVHYHIIGPEDHGAYVKRVKAEADRYDFVHVDGMVSSDTLAELLSTHRYGLHGMRHEHFGIAVAEMAAAGMVPFVHASGGQQEILETIPEVRYDGLANGINTIERVLSNPEQQRRLHQTVSKEAGRFSEDRFQREIRATVAREIDD